LRDAGARELTTDHVVRITILELTNRYEEIRTKGSVLCRCAD